MCAWLECSWSKRVKAHCTKRSCFQWNLQHPTEGLLSGLFIAEELCPCFKVADLPKGQTVMHNTAIKAIYRGSLSAWRCGMKGCVCRQMIRSVFLCVCTVLVRLFQSMLCDGTGWEKTDLADMWSVSAVRLKKGGGGGVQPDNIIVPTF